MTTRAIDVPCPACKASPNAACRTALGWVTPGFHPARVDAAARATRDARIDAKRARA